MQTRTMDPTRTEIADQMAGRRRGIAGRALRVWYRLTAPNEPSPSAPFSIRERARRGRLLSLILLGFLLILAGGFYQYAVVDDDHPVMLIVLGVALGVAVVVAALNRLGQTALAGMLMVLLAELPLAGPFAATRDGQLDILHLGAFYLIVGSLLVAASVLAPWSVVPVALLNCAASLAILALRPRTPALAALLGSNDGQQAFFGPIVMQVIVAIVAYLWAQNTIAALRRADRAEEIAALERREIERQRELEEGVRQLLAVHVHLANGDFSARAGELRSPQLWQVGKSLNVLIARLGRYAQAESVLRREQEEAQRLAEALYNAQSGRPAVWPAPSGLPLDVVTEAARVASGHVASGHVASGHVASGRGGSGLSATDLPTHPSGGYPSDRRLPGWSPWPSPTPSPSPASSPNASRNTLPDWLRP